MNFPVMVQPPPPPPLKKKKKNKNEKTKKTYNVLVYFNKEKETLNLFSNINKIFMNSDVNFYEITLQIENIKLLCLCKIQIICICIPKIIQTLYLCSEWVRDYCLAPHLQFCSAISWKQSTFNGRMMMSALY